MRRRPGWFLAVLGVASGLACQTTLPIPDGVEDDKEPNNTFANAQTLVLDAADRVSLRAAIGTSDDIDVFDAGPVAAGDVVTVEVQRIATGLETSLALFDDEGELIAEDTLTSVDLDGADPALVHAVREDSTKLWVAVTHNLLGPSVGAYELSVDIERGGVIPSRRGQVVRLNFAGGTVVDPVFGELTVGPFDAGDIDPAYDGATEVFKAVIVATVLENYAGLDITFITSDIGGTPAGEYSEIVFGGFNALAFGAAEDVDAYNNNQADRAIIFTSSFEPFLFGFVPTAEEMAVGIGNVAAHELGHLLGLNHVNDATALMDEASPAVTLLDDQEFKSAPLAESIFPLGLHDSADLLRVTLGEVPLAHLAGPQSSVLPGGYHRQVLNWPTDPGPVVPRAKCANCMLRAERAGAGRGAESAD